MRRSILVRGVEYPLAYPISAQDKVLKILELESFSDFSDEKNTQKLIGSPIMLGKVAFVGLDTAARRDRKTLPFTEDEFFDEVSECLVAFEQLLDDLGFGASAKKDQAGAQKK